MLRDSKLCQLEQIKEKEKLTLEKNDFNEAWHEVLVRDFQQKTENERISMTNKHQEGLAVQDYLKYQMCEKIERNLKIHEEINKELEQISIERKENAERELERKRNEEKVCKMLKDEMMRQIQRNAESIQERNKAVLKMEQTLNEEARRKLMMEEATRRADQVFYKILDYSFYLFSIFSGAFSTRSFSLFRLFTKIKTTKLDGRS